MEKIASFTVDHLNLIPGVYVSRKDHIGSEVVTTFDIRMTRPNYEPVMNTAEVHTIEHLGATFLRNDKEYGSKVVYFGPMGCQTGFYLLIRNADNDEVLRQIRLTLCKIIAHEGEVFGASSRECGNYRNLSLDAAKTEARRYLAELDARPVTFIYEE